jgi:hypothetical protein
MAINGPPSAFRTTEIQLRVERPLGSGSARLGHVWHSTLTSSEGSRCAWIFEILLPANRLVCGVVSRPRQFGDLGQNIAVILNGFCGRSCRNLAQLRSRVADQRPGANVVSHKRHWCSFLSSLARVLRGSFSGGVMSEEQQCFFRCWCRRTSDGLN